MVTNIVDEDIDLSKKVIELEAEIERLNKELLKEVENRLRIEYCPDPGDTWDWGYYINCPECGVEIYIGK